jgi:hypothetical protein
MEGIAWQENKKDKRWKINLLRNDVNENSGESIDSEGAS